MKDVLHDLEKLEEQLRKGIREGEYFGDSYVCGIANKLYEIQQKLKNNKNLS